MIYTKKRVLENLEEMISRLQCIKHNMPTDDIVKEINWVCNDYFTNHCLTPPYHTDDESLVAFIISDDVKK